MSEELPTSTPLPTPPALQVTATRLQTNLLLERIANVLELIAEKSFGLELHPTTDGMSAADLDRIDSAPPVWEEARAAIELLEEEGVRVPPEAYRRLGLDSPHERYEPPAEPESESEAEPPTARRPPQ
jgi:hypothetical protein